MMKKCITLKLYSSSLVFYGSWDLIVASLFSLCVGVFMCVCMYVCMYVAGYSYNCIWRNQKAGNKEEETQVSFV